MVLLLSRASRVRSNVVSLNVTPKELRVPFICSYLVYSEEELAIVESGPTSSSRLLVGELEKLKLKNKKVYIIPTHIHLDHGGGTGSLLRLLENSKAYIHPKGVKHVLEPSKLWSEARAALGWLAEVYGAPEPGVEGRVYPTSDGLCFDIGNSTLRVLHTPGHASHHQSVFLEEESILFVGDSAGIYVREVDYVVPTTMPIIRFNMYVDSLKKQLKLNPSTIAYTHYGLSTRGAEVLEAHIRQVKAWFDAVREAYEDGVLDFEGVLERVLKVDEEPEKLKRVLRYSRAHELLVRLSIEGLKLEVERILERS